MLCKVEVEGLRALDQRVCRGNVIVRPRCQSAPFITCLRARLPPLQGDSGTFSIWTSSLSLSLDSRARSSFPGYSSIGWLSERITGGASMMPTFIPGDKMQIKQLC